MTSAGRAHDRVVQWALLTVSALWAVCPPAARADNCPRGSNSPCPANNGQHSQPPPPQPAARPPMVPRPPPPYPQPYRQPPQPTQVPQPPQRTPPQEQTRLPERGHLAAPVQAHTPPPTHLLPARRDEAPSLAQHRVQLSPSASLVTHPGHSGFTAVDRESAHASIVVEQHADRHGRAQVNAYRQVTSPDGRTITRLYADGRRTVESPTFRSTGQLGGPQFVRYRNGLRAAYLPGGRPLYTERFTKVSAPGGRSTVSLVERTIYATGAGGRFTPLSQPLRRWYTIAPIGGFDRVLHNAPQL